MTISQMLLAAVVALPGLLFLALGLGWLLGWAPSEKTMSRLTALCYSTAVALAAALFWRLLGPGGEGAVSLRLGSWFSVHRYEFPLQLFADWISLPLIGLVLTLAGLIGAFSRRYLHRDRGFHRFFLLLHLFAFGAVLVFAAGAFDLIVAGWELVGVTSVLLIAFFYERPDPVRSSLAVFSIYRLTDLGLLWAVFLMHHSLRTTRFEDVLTSGTAAPAIALLLIFAASGKSAQVPFSGWLPRAMEGPTPSSAIFYGAISVHLGAYLLLRSSPLIAATPALGWLLVALGLATAAHASMTGRACADAKTSLAYASLAQLGLIFAEVGMGWLTLALLHIIGHGATRTLQFLRAPSMLHDFHQVHSAAGGHLEPTGEWFERLPESARLWLYRYALDRGHHDTLRQRFIESPVLALSAWLRAIDERFLTLDPPSGAPPRKDESAGRITRPLEKRADA